MSNASVDMTAQAVTVPWYVRAFALCIAALGLCFGLVFTHGVQSAYAFEYNGNTYPDFLGVSDSFPSGVTVIMAAHPVDPATYYGGNFTLHTYGYAPVRITRENASTIDTTYIYSESGTSDNNPWFLALSPSKSIASGTVKAFYDGGTGSGHYSWWPDSVLAFTFYATQNEASSLSAPSLYSDQNFIRYICDNSDFFTRYPNFGTPDLEITITYNSNTSTFTFSYPVTPDSIVVQKRESMNVGWEDFLTLSSLGEYAQNWTATASGQYRFVASKTGYNSYTSDSWSVTINSGIPEQVLSVAGWTVEARTGGVAGGVQPQTKFTVFFNDPQPDVVILQFESTPGHWIDIVSMGYGNTGNGTGWWYEGRLDSGNYRIVASRVGLDDLVYVLGEVDTSTAVDLTAFGQIGQWIQEVIDGIGNFFSWLPDELRVFIVSAIVAIVLLGVVQLVKP